MQHQSVQLGVLRITVTLGNDDVILVATETAAASVFQIKPT
jgi:hypothetical protein